MLFFFLILLDLTSVKQRNFNLNQFIEYKVKLLSINLCLIGTVQLVCQKGRKSINQSINQLGYTGFTHR